MKILIQKFGGTSVEDARAMSRSIEIVRTLGILRGARPLVVLSACAGVTNALIRISELSLKENTSEALTQVDQLEVRHARIARELLADPDSIARVQQFLHTLWEELRKFVRGINLLRELTPKSRDQIVSMGERASSFIFHAALREQLETKSIECNWYDTRNFFITSNEFTSARPIVKEIERHMTHIRSAIEKGAVGVTQGFTGRTRAGEVTTIGRGGSDFSAAIMGVAVNASEIQIWTDVAGIMTSDPRVVKGAYSIERISFQEASELAFFGAKVLHPETIWPAVQKSIPVRVLSSKDPKKKGTVIVAKTKSNTLTGIAIKKGISLVRISSGGALPNPEVDERVWSALKKSGLAPLAVSLSVDAACYAFGEAAAVPILRGACEGHASVTIEKDLALITLVGDRLESQSGVAAKIFRTLGHTNCTMISYGGSQSSITLAVPEDGVDKIVKKLHAEFFE